MDEWDDSRDEWGEINRTPGTLTVYSDISCPWATLTLHGLRRAARRSGLAPTIDHRAFCLELINREPTPKQVLDAEIPVAGGLDDTLGWRLWQGSDAEFPVTTLPALEAVQAAKDPNIGGLAASDQLDAALRHAFFAESRCVSLLPVILDVAESCPRVDAAALTEAMELCPGRAAAVTQTQTARAGGVQGSPHVFLPDGRSWHNPGVTVRWTESKGRGLPVVSNFDPSIYDQIIADVTETMYVGQ